MSEPSCAAFMDFPPMVLKSSMEPIPSKRLQKRLVLNGLIVLHGSCLPCRQRIKPVLKAKYYSNDYSSNCNRLFHRGAY